MIASARVRSRAAYAKKEIKTESVDTKISDALEPRRLRKHAASASPAPVSREAESAWGEVNVNDGGVREVEATEATAGYKENIRGISTAAAAAAAQPRSRIAAWPLPFTEVG
jgi:hypothetical protein